MTHQGIGSRERQTDRLTPRREEGGFFQQDQQVLSLRVGGVQMCGNLRVGKG
jgi:hypothetical protein